MPLWTWPSAALGPKVSVRRCRAGGLTPRQARPAAPIPRYQPRGYAVVNQLGRSEPPPLLRGNRGYERFGSRDMAITLWRTAASSVVGLSGLALGLIASRQCSRGPANVPSPAFERSRLISALGPLRPGEGRLTGLAYCPYRDNDSVRPSGRTFVQEAARIMRTADRFGSLEAMTNLALVKVVANRPEEAVLLLEQACVRAPSNPVFLSDLSAAYLLRARQRSQPYDWFRALGASDRALSIDGGSREALFNQAVALSRLYLSKEAEAAWKRYLELDSGSAWAAEAKTHLFKLRGPTFAQRWNLQRSRVEARALAGDCAFVQSLAEKFPQAAREYAEYELLPAWASALQGGQSLQARRLLAAARGIGEVLASSAADPMVLDTVVGAEKVAGPRGAHRPAAPLLAALADYHKGQSLRHTQGPGSALHLPVSARRLFDRARSPLSHLVALDIAASLYELSRLGRALRSLERLPGSARNRYPDLRARAEWIRGMCELASGKPSASLATYKRGLVTFRGLKEIENAGALELLIAENLRYLGEGREEWSHRYRALAALEVTLPATRAIATLDEVAEAVEHQVGARPALHFRREVVAIAESRQDPLDLFWAWMRLGETDQQLGRVGEARAALERAHTLYNRVSDPGVRLRWEADLVEVEAEAILSRDPAASVRALTKAIASYRATGSYLRLGILYFQRALARLRSSDPQGAAPDLEFGLREYEKRRQEVTEDHLRASYFSQAVRVFNEMIRIQLISGRPEEAFALAERRHARVLLDRWGFRVGTGPRSNHPLLLAALRSNLPPGVSLIEYSVLDDRLVAWVINNDEMAWSESFLQPDSLAAQIERLRASGENGVGTAELAQNSAELFDFLIRPSLSHVRQGDLLVLVPDKDLFAIPFPALFDTKSRTFLIESHPVIVAPSATLFLRAIEREGVLAGQPGKSLILFADPRPDETLATRLPELPGAAEEAVLLRALYPDATALTGKDATKEAFLREAGQYSIVQFSGHAVINGEVPALSRLLLSPGSRAPGALYAHEIDSLDLAKTRLVVLAACRSAGGQAAAGEGLMSLARSFFGTGVPAVVADLWDVEDQGTANFLRVFHRRLRRGDNAARALRAAQLWALHNPDPRLNDSRRWAGFELWGGVLRGFPRGS